jgi:hypothetical protein
LCNPPDDQEFKWPLAALAHRSSELTLRAVDAYPGKDSVAQDEPSVLDLIEDADLPNRILRVLLELDLSCGEHIIQ